MRPRKMSADCNVTLRVFDTVHACGRRVREESSTLVREDNYYNSTGGWLLVIWWLLFFFSLALLLNSFPKITIKFLLYRFVSIVLHWHTGFEITKSTYLPRGICLKPEHYGDTVLDTKITPLSRKCSGFNPFPKKLRRRPQKFSGKRVKPYTYRTRGAVLTSRTE